ncbi:hypothetical protein ACFL3N_00750, partial [Candidatus Omnitrophota bacterium]
IGAGAIFAGAVLAVFLLFSVILFVRRKSMASFIFIAVSVIAFLYPLNTLILPEVGVHETSRKISAELVSLMKGDELVGSESHYREGIAFYADKDVADLDRHHDLVQFLSSKKRVYAMLKKKNYIQLYTLDTVPYFTKPSYMIYSLGKKCIVTNIMPKDGDYLLKMER